MIGALAVEWMRLRQRRAVRLLALVALLGCLVVLGFAIANAVPPSAADMAAAQSQVDRQMADPMFQQQLADCRQAVASGGSDQWPADLDCDEAMTPRVEWFLNWSPPNFVDDFRHNLLAVTLILALAMALAGVTFAGADWSAGTIGTQLLYQPRRVRVFGSKAGALAAAGLLVGLIGAVLAWAVSYAVAAKWGTTALLDTRISRDGSVTLTQLDITARALRAVAAVAGAAIGGYVLAMLFRSSLVAVAIIAGYGIVGEALIRGLFTGSEPYLLSSRILAWLQGPYQIARYPRSCGPGPCQPEITTVTVTAGGVYLAVLVALGLAVAGLLFARRDVS
ncbi:MAG TPA: hypothetical protein VFM01_15775 [Nakamurella sp.]|nr:hypothetical protein [Nakamurella sp.]